MVNVVLTALSMTIGFFFILIGTLKLTPAINEEVYREMVSVTYVCSKTLAHDPLEYYRICAVPTTATPATVATVPATRLSS